MPLNQPVRAVYKGQKKPDMPCQLAEKGILPLEVLCSQLLSAKEAKENIFQFIQDIIQIPSTPDFGGYNTLKLRKSESNGQDDLTKPVTTNFEEYITKKQGKTNSKVNQKSTILYEPLINEKPSDPSTILTAMYDVEKATHQAGQSITVFTCDQQLFRVTLDIMWDDPDRWSDFIPRLGGMHWLMSFIGSIGQLMKNSGLDRLMKAAFGGVEKMLIGKKFPQNVRALRIIVIELLRPLIGPDVVTECELNATMEELSAKSILAEHWIKNLIHPVILAMMFIQAERNGRFDLHLYACKEMLPYFFAAGHWNYARDGVAYLRYMEKLPSSPMEKFIKGEHVVHLKDGYFNGIWSDMAIETSYMNVGKGNLAF